MKKSAVALGAVIVLGGVWTGGAWYTGQTAEAEYQRQIELFNHKMAMMAASTSGVDVKIENVKFERGLFSSDVSYDIAVKSLTEAEEDQVFPLEAKIYHGPLPLDHVRRFDFTPAMFSAVTRLVKNEKTQIWFDAVNGKEPFVADAVMNYSQRVKGGMHIAAGEVKLQGVDVSWSEANVIYDTDKDGEGRYEYDVARMKSLFTSEGLEKYAGIQQDDHLNSMDIELNGLKGVYDLQPTALPNIFIGDHNGSLAELKYTYTYKDDKTPPIWLSFKNWAFNYNATQQGDFLNYGLKNKIEATDLNGHLLGQLQFDIQFNHLAAEVMSRILAISPNDQAALQQAGLELLRNQPHLQIAPLTLTDGDGKLDAELNIELSDADFTRALQGKFLSLFKQLSLQMSADKKTMANIISIVAQVDGKPKEEADQLAQQQVTDYVLEAVQDGSVLETEKSISASLILDNGELKFNGNVIPEEYIGMFLLGLMMQQ